MKLLKLVLFLISVLNFHLATSQTNPSPQNLPFSFDAQTGSALPAGIALHRFGTTAASIPTTRILTSGNADLPYNTGATTGGWRGEGENGIGILASGSNAAGALVLAINTTGQTNIHTCLKTK